MKRSVLFARVWSDSMVQVARQLGISDVGLTKLCRRLDIPVPAMGHWARAPARRVPQPALPDPNRDPDIVFPDPDPAQRQHNIERARIRRDHAKAAGLVTSTLPPVSVPAELLKPHPLVGKTQAFFKDVARRISPEVKAVAMAGSMQDRMRYVFQRPQTMFGRYTSNGNGRLHIAATLTQIDWVLRFHEGLLRALQAERMAAVPVVDFRGKEWIELHKDRQALLLSFVEAFDKVPTPEDLYEKHTYRPRDFFKLRVEGRHTFRKEWAASRAGLEEMLPTIVAELLQAPAAEAAGEELAERERVVQEQADAIAAAEAARLAAIEAERKEAERLRLAQAQARADQWSTAVAAAEERDRIDAVLRLLDAFDRGVAALPAEERTVAEAWSRLVRRQAEARDPVHALLQFMRGPDDKDDLPLWWSHQDS